jgi:hypothetical protein
MNEEEQLLVIPARNDIEVTAKFLDLSQAVGVIAQFWRKETRATPDDDKSVILYEQPLVANPDQEGQWLAVFSIPASDNTLPGITWWRVDAVAKEDDIVVLRRTAACGPYRIEGV